MKRILLAKRYAKALFEIALQQQAVAEVNDDMELLVKVMAENRELRKLMSNPLITPLKKNQLMMSIFGSHLSKISKKFIEILIRKGREQEVTEIAHQYHQLYLDHNNIAEAQLVTAYPADDYLRERITQLALFSANKTLRFKESVQPDIIGGFKLQIDDYLYDATIKKIIADLHKEFAKNLYIKRF
jgi:F-type H+-transporting ATPase subunit delta